MTLSLKQIQDLAWGPEQSTIEVTMTSGARVTLEQSPSNRPLKDSWLWLQRSFQTRKPVAFDPAAQNVLPSTVVLSVELTVPAEGENVRVFGPPRPGLMQLDKSSPDANDLLEELQKVETSGASAVLALRGGTWIEDVEVLTQIEAKQMLGFASP